MSPRQSAGMGVRAGAGRRCPVCSIPFDPSIDGWRCVHSVYAASSYAQKRIAVELAIAKRLDEEDREDAAHRAAFVDSPAAKTVGEGAPESGMSPGQLTKSPFSAGDPCLHGFADWTSCPTCCAASDFDNGEPT